MTAEAELTCQELVEIVTAYLDDALSSPERARFDAHLGTCANCRAYLGQFQRTISLTGHLREDDIAPEARERMLSAFRDWRSGA